MSYKDYQMIRGSAIYTPQKKTAAILDRAWELVEAVPYQVSARWVFYRLLQEGYYSKKSDYGAKFLKAISTARRNFYKEWRPDTLADETRAAIERGQGFSSVAKWLGAVSKADCQLDKWAYQDCYIELWYEARAMTDQFRHYTQHITLRPLGGQPSIPYKWETAKYLERVNDAYDVPITILYFGDLDTAGEVISEVVERDVRVWCDAEFDFIRCGLTADQVTRYQVPENPEKPGEYQWEALPDYAAREIISGHVDKLLRHDAFSTIHQEERAATAWLRSTLMGLADSWVKPN